MKKILSLLLTAAALTSMTGCIIEDGHHHGHGHGGVYGHEYYKDHSYNQGNHYRGGGHHDHHDH